ncbi:hypothetical protein KVR01_010627 [Diaporthe batatas]|uniref:uncharacterized protein n=1 Tax=Diaporthe batatas TaxID=748121 RepID=UPI001D05022D|nr:uncharacterized protein KVR01_010627 [Diaporthe batatas]KAG8159990.1 hypothetical protein KVR01_010627 [Diaporthe batatas]
MSSLSSLPDEVIILIAEACDVPDKARLARSNRRLNDLATRVLLRYSVKEAGNSAMFWAAEHGHINTLERMRSYGAEINDTSGSRLATVVRRLDSFPQHRLYSSTGFSPLHIAAKFGQNAAVKWLLRNGARIESLAQHVCQCEPRLGYAGHIGDFDDDDDNIYNAYNSGSHGPHAWSPLHISICSGNTSTAKLLISHGALIQSPERGPFPSTNIFHTAARRNNIAAIEFLVRNGMVGVDEPDSDGFFALHHACSSPDNLQALKMLIHLGASLDILEPGGRTPLRTACLMGFFDGAVVLLAEGASYDISSTERAAILLRISTRPCGCFPPQHRSADPAIWEKRREDFLRRLVAMGVNIDERVPSFQEVTPLAAAAAQRGSRLHTLQVLLELGADVNAVDSMQKNAIYLLLAEGGRNFWATPANKVDLLLRYGARPDMRSKSGNCALDMALRLSVDEGDATIMGFILQHALVAPYGHIYVRDQITRSFNNRCFDECRILARYGAVLELSDERLEESIKAGIYSRDMKHIDSIIDLFPGRTTPSEVLKVALKNYKTLGRGESRIIKNLLARPEFDSPGNNAASRLLQVACRYHSPVPIAQLLLEKGAQVNGFDSWWETPLSCAVACGCRPMVRFLLLHGADPHMAPLNKDWSAYVYEVTHKSDGHSAYMPDTGYPTAFTRAITELHNHRLIRCSCKPNADETLPRPLELILEHLPLPLLPKDPRALSYIHLALEWPEALQVLLAKGADPNSGDHCVRPPLLYFLDMADKWKPANPDALRLLLEFGADIHRTDDRGRSFLTMMKWSRIPMADGMLDNGEFEGEGLGPTACSLLRNFFGNLVRSHPYLAKANYGKCLDRWAVSNDGKMQITF